ncbi:adenylate/guanylate cyclase domain-containing protein [Planctomycetota bacterium]|nr:adenylate/guanylate cyclase domain-containing protein [Planctomycetota bacterium]
MNDELSILRERMTFNAILDERLEEVSRKRVSLGEALGATLPLVCTHLGAQRVWIETLGEDLETRTFAAGAEGPLDVDGALVDAVRDLVRADRPDAGYVQHASGTLLAQALDVAGEHFGTFGALLLGELEEAERGERLASLKVAAELLDNYLIAIRDAREKQRLLRAIHEALRHPLVHTGVELAVAELADTVAFKTLIVVYHLEQDSQRTLHYLVFRGKDLAFDSFERVAAELDGLLRGAEQVSRADASTLIGSVEFEHGKVTGGPAAQGELPHDQLVKAAGYHECLDTLLITGLTKNSVVGQVVIGSDRPLSTYERDVLNLFSDVLQTRIVDFNRAGQHLHRTFSIPQVLRLLKEEDPYARLTPRSTELSILYADVAGFTRLSEQILVDPTRVSKFVDTWSRGVTAAIWAEGGVFDKLVGDCVIGLFGPPYYEWTPAERAAACARAAAGIVKFTNAMIDDPSVELIKAAGVSLGVSIGINDCRASVGLFGPNQDFTAFSTGMNNTARLQAQAGQDEVLVMQGMKELLEPLGFQFGERHEGKAKNVAEPLISYPLNLDALPTE